MDREFLDLYNRELQLLHEQAREFAEEYPGIAERLGGLVARPHGSDDRAACWKARPSSPPACSSSSSTNSPEFTSNLLEQLVPNYLAPTPSAMLAKVDAAFRRSGVARRPPHCARLLSRRDLPRARRSIACRYRLMLATSRSGRSTSPAPSTSRRRARCRRSASRSGPRCVAGLRLSLTHRTAARIEDEMPDGAGRRSAERLVRRLPHARSCRSICSAPRPMRSRSTSSSSPTASASTSAISTSSAIR